MRPEIHYQFKIFKMADKTNIYFVDNLNVANLV